MATSASGRRRCSLCLALKSDVSSNRFRDKEKKKLTLLGMNKNVLLTREEVCLFAVHRIQQDGIDGLEASISERRPLCDDALRSINDAVIRGTY